MKSSKYGKTAQLFYTTGNLYPQLIKSGKEDTFESFCGTLVSDSLLTVNASISIDKKENRNKKGNSVSKTITSQKQEMDVEDLPEKIKKMSQRVSKFLTETLKLKINKITFYPNENTSKPVLCFFMNEKFCNNIKMKHSSNNVFYTYNISESLLTQKCFKCSGFSENIEINVMYDDL